MNKVLAAWGLDDAELTKLSSGLINQTWRVRSDDGERILQSLNTAIFDPVLHEDIDAVTAHLAAKGLPTPRLVRTRDDRLWADIDGECWRLQTVVGNRTIERVDDLADAERGGALVARFHRATADLDYVFQNPRSQGVFHDTAAKVVAMRQALSEHRGDVFWDETAALADRVEQLWASLASDVELPERVVHGDLKISNLRFQDGEAVALIDLDTLARGTLDAELGDALRSWCNTAGEDAPPCFDLGVLEAAMRGYASEADDVCDAEWAAVVPGTMRIAVELAARFAADALQRSYFGFDPALGSGRHNVIRAQGQLDLAEQIAALRDEAERVVALTRG